MAELVGAWSVVRPGPWSSTVQQLLPQTLGRDEQGRELMGFLPARTVGDDHP